MKPHFIISIILAAVSIQVAPAYSQVAPSQFGIVPNGSYESYQVEAVNLQNLSDIIKIPLFSLPQLGRLSLSFSVVANTTYWQPDEYCTTDGYSCTYYYTFQGPAYAGFSGIGPEIVADDSAIVLPEFYAAPIDCADSPIVGYPLPNIPNCYSTIWTVYDSTGGSHPLYYDANNPSNLRTTDGSGYLFQSGESAPWNHYYLGSSDGPPDSLLSTPTLIDSKGISSTSSSNSAVQKDPDGNTIITDSQITDSVGRHIPFIPAPTSSTAGCPNLGGQYQATTGSSTWNVPGANNSTSTYLICYTQIAYRTSFLADGTIYGEDPSGNNYEITYEDAVGSNQVIQSIVLPDGSYWGFLYDAADPNNSNSVGYATMTKMVFPEGGSVQYSYINPGSVACNVQTYPTLYLQQRTVNDANGHSYLWQYGLGRSTDPNGNDSVVTYQGPSYGGCSPSAEKRP